MKKIFFGIFAFFSLFSAAAARTTGSVLVDFEPAKNEFLRRGEIVEIGKISFRGTGEKTQISRIAITFSGDFSDADFSRARLFFGDILVGSGGKISKNAILFSDLNFFVHDGQTKTLRAEIEISPTAKLGARGKFFFKNRAAIAVKTEKYHERTVLGKFPSAAFSAAIVGKTGDFVGVFWEENSPEKTFFLPKKNAFFADFFLDNFSDKPHKISSIKMRIDGDFPVKNISRVFLKNIAGKTISTGIFVEKGVLVFSDPIFLLPNEKARFSLFLDIKPDEKMTGDLVFSFSAADDFFITNATAVGDFPLFSPRKSVAKNAVTVDDYKIINTVFVRGQKNAKILSFSLFSPFSTKISKISFSVSRPDLFQKIWLENADGEKVADGIYDRRVGKFVFSAPMALFGDKKIFFLRADFSDALGNFLLFPMKVFPDRPIPVFERRIREVYGVVGESHFSVLATADFSFLTKSFFAGLSDATILAVRFSSPKPLQMRKVSIFLTDADKIIKNPRLLDDRGQKIADGEISGNEISFFPQKPFSFHRHLRARFVADISEKAAGKKLWPILFGRFDLQFFTIDGVKRVESTGNFPISAPIKKIKSIPKNALLVRMLPIETFFSSRGKKNVKIGKIMFSTKDINARITDISLSFSKNPSDFFQNIRLESDSGEILRGKIDQNLAVFSGNLRVDRRTKKTFWMVADIADGAPVETPIFPFLNGPDAIRANVKIIGHFPIRGSATEIIEKQCSDTPVCGLLNGERKMFLNKCEMKKADAIFLAESKCPVTKNAFSPFSDLLPGDDFFEAAVFLKNRGILVGFSDGTFRPKKFISRAAFAKVLTRALFSDAEIAECPDQNSFFDVFPSQWFSSFVCVAKRHHLISGFPDGSFRPAENISFAAAAKMIARAFSPEISTKNISPWYAPFVRFLSEKNAIPPSITSVSQKITRGEVAEILFRLLTQNEKKKSAKWRSGILAP